jgi:hypothetical protein
MADIDLIPPEYRDWLEKRAMLKSFATSIAIFAVLILTSGKILETLSTRAESAAVELRSENAITQQQHQQLQSLQERETEYTRHWSLLRGLRAGAAVEDIFQIIDRSLQVGELWFLDWSFRRAGVIVDGQQRGVETGYFVIVSTDSDAGAAVEFEVETHMAISGQANDHQALSTFVRSLFGQELIKDVSVQKTSRSDAANGSVVDFDLTVVLNSKPKGS